MDGMRPDLFILDEVGGTTEAPDRCCVPGCAHPESVHKRCHCETCHTMSETVRKATGFKPGLCVHYYFPPGEPGDT